MSMREVTRENNMGLKLMQVNLNKSVARMKKRGIDIKTV